MGTADDRVAGLAARLEQLEARLRVVEDLAAINQVVASYGPAADSCDGDAVRALWAEGGTYELQGWFYTSDTMAETVTSDLHHRYVAAGSAHVMSAPKITLDGNRAVAVNHSRVFVHEGDRWIVDRAAANRWDLERTPAGWKVRRRVNRLLDGNAEARSLLAGEEPPAADQADRDQTASDR
ncbi:MAG TPA: nuclear transport factor 2 family protein [Acidimicrobiales bacterium]|jgi:hypothetical protein